MTRTTTALTALALTAAAGAQAPYTTGSTVTYSLGFREIGGNTNGTLEPGESALVQISVAFSNQNTTATFAPPAKGFSSGTIRGLAQGVFDLNGHSNNGGSADGAWNTDFVNPGLGPILDPWDLVGPPGWGTPASGGSQLRLIQFGQLPQFHYQIITTNPINLLWQALWTPTNYDPRTVTFTAGPAFPQPPNNFVYFKLSNLFLLVPPVACPSIFGSVSIPLIPAPASVVILAAPFLSRRRRTPIEVTS